MDLNEIDEDTLNTFEEYLNQLESSKIDVNNLLEWIQANISIPIDILQEYDEIVEDVRLQLKNSVIERGEKYVCKLYKYLCMKRVLDENLEAPEQGSLLWKKNRMGSVGGSDMATFYKGMYKHNRPFNDIRGFVRQKLELEQFKTIPAMRWGHIFEELSRKYTELQYGCSIYETGTLPGAIEYQTFSPDGLGVVREDRIYEGGSPNKYLYTLFEFKSPASRVPEETKDGSPVRHGHYEIQVLTGLCSIPRIDVGLFCDISFRKCRMGDLGMNNRYDRKFHKWDANKDQYTFEQPLAWGFIGIYKPLEVSDEAMLRTVDEYTMARMTGIEKSNCVIDFGSADFRVFNLMATIIVDYKRWKCYYPTMGCGHFDTNREMKSFRKFCKNNGQLIGYIPYKLFKAHFVPIEKQENFLEPVKKDIKKYMKQVVKYQKLPVKKRWKGYYKIFGIKEAPESKQSKRLVEMLKESGML